MSGETPTQKPPFKVGGFAVPRKLVYGFLVVLVYASGAAFAIGYANRDRTTTPTPTASASSGTSSMNRCWDGKRVPRGTLCDTDYDGKTLFWAFGLDPTELSCERAKDYDWSDIGFNCTYRGADLRMAIWKTPDWRDQRLVEYGDPKPLSKGLIRHEPGEAERTLIRYDSDRALLYASTKAESSNVIAKLLPRVKSRTELLYGTKAP